MLSSTGFKFQRSFAPFVARARRAGGKTTRLLAGFTHNKYR